MSLTKEQGWDIFQSKWDNWKTKTNDRNATQQDMDAEFKVFTDSMLETVALVTGNHPEPPPPRIRPGS